MISDNLKRLRIERGLTQQQVGEKLGITKQAYSQWESGKHTPRFETIKKLADILGVTTDQITEDYAQTYDDSETDSFTERLKELRKEKGLNQIEIANYFGTSQPAYQAWESGRRTPAQKSLEKLAKFFNVSVSYLLGETSIRNFSGLTTSKEQYHAPSEQTIGERLKSARKEAGLLQEEVAEHFNITQQAYQVWESGKRNPKKETLQKLADYFNVSYAYLAGVESPLESAEILFKNKVKELELTPEQEEQFKSSIYNFILQKGNQYNNQEISPESFAKRLKRLRKEAHLTQQDVADYFKTSPQSYAQWEKGQRSPSKESLEKLASYFGVSVSYLVGESDTIDYGAFEEQSTPTRLSDDKTFIERLKELRKQSGLTQQQLADIVGTTQQNIAFWETGRQRPKQPSLIKLANYFNVSIDYLLVGKAQAEEKSSVFPERLRQLRIETDLTQQELAKNLNVSQQIIGLWERGERKPKIEAITNIAEYFNVSPKYLIGETNNREIETIELEAEDKLFKATVKDLNLTPEQKEEFKESIYHFILRKRDSYSDDKQEVYKVPQEEARALELDNTANTTFGERQRQVRELTGLTQIEMAIKLGTSQPAYQAWEAGRREPNLESLKKLAKVLNTSPNYLLGYNQTESIAKAIPQENAFPERLKELRKMANLTQIEIAEALNISQPAYVEWEKGRTQPTPDKFPLIAKVLNTSIYYLLQGAPNEIRLANFQGKTLGERLVFLRRNAGLTQAEVADRLQVGQNSYSNWENGVRTPIYPIIEKLAEFFGVTPDSLRGKTDNVVVPKITITPNQNQETEIIDLLNNKLTYNQKTLTSKDKKFFTSVIKSYFGD